MRTAPSQTIPGNTRSNGSTSERQDRLRRAVDCVAHLLPLPGPIGVFVHHNTLHSFQDLPFEQAGIEASRLYSAGPYLTEADYTAEMARGRIRLEHMVAVLAS